MAIKGLTDRDLQFNQALVFLGHFNKGGEKPERGIGKDLDYFRFTPATGQEDIAMRIEQRYGAKPTSFAPLLFPSNDVDSVFEAWMQEKSTGGKLRRRCDGETQLLRWENDEWQRDPVPCIKDAKTPCACRQNGRLAFILPEIAMTGFFYLYTGSTYDIVHIINHLRWVNAVAGQLTGLPFTLYRQPQEMNATIKGKRARVTKSLVKLKVEDGAIARFAQERLPRTVDPETGEVLSLTSGSAEVVDDGVGNSARAWTLMELRVDAFFDWCAKEFELQPAEVMDALRVETIEDFRQDEKSAMAHVLAYWSGYDRDMIDSKTSTMPGRDDFLLDLRDMAREIEA